MMAMHLRNYSVHLVMMVIDDVYGKIIYICHVYGKIILYMNMHTCHVCGILILYMYNTSISSFHGFE